MAQGGVSGQNAQSQKGDCVQHSLFADLQALAADGRNFLEAEIAFQRTRLAYAGGRGKSALIAIALALVLAIFALFALIIGVLLALTPYLSAWGATALVVGVILLVAILLAMSALRNFQRIKAAFHEDDEEHGFHNGE